MKMKQLEDNFLEIKNAIITILHLSDNYRFNDYFIKNRQYELSIFSDTRSSIDIVFDKTSREIRIHSYIKTNCNANEVSNLYSKRCVNAKKSGMHNTRDSWGEYNIFRRNHIFKISDKNIDRIMIIFQIFIILNEK